MNISNERIEAASEPMRMKYCRSTNCTASNCECRAMTRLILTADAPALADAEIRGLRLALKIARETEWADGAIKAAIDIRTANLAANRDKDKTK